MAYSVCLFLDPVSTETITGLWRRLAEMHVSESLFQAAFRPHVTLGIADRLELDPCTQYLAEFANTHTAFPLNFSSLGLFPSRANGAVFLGVTPSPQLLEIHIDFHLTFSVYGTGLRRYYFPGVWVPHCTLADGISCEAAPTAIEVCQATELPIRATAAGIGILEFPPGFELLSYSLRSH